MKAILFSDLHLDTLFAIAGAPAKARRRRQAIRDTLTRIIDLAIEESADIVLCGGDLYENDRVTPDTAAFVRDQFQRLAPIPIFIAPGNHDWYGPRNAYAAEPWSPNVHIFNEPQLTPYPLEDGLTLWGAAHCAPAGTESFLNAFHVDRGGVHLALFHGSERNALLEQGEGKLPHAPFEAGDIERSGIHHAFLGHYHRRKYHQWFTYPGNPNPIGFGEDSDRGAAVIEISVNGNVDRRCVRVAAGEAHDVETELKEVSSLQDVRAQVARAIGGLAGSVRLKLTGDIPPEVDLRPNDLTDLGSSLDTFVVDTGMIRKSLSLADIASDPTVKGLFVRLVQSSDLAEDEQQRVLLTGLRALDKRDDLEVR